jgi:hypothetical protein
MFDIHSEMAAVQALAPAVQSATIEGSTIDLKGFSAAEIVINTGAVAGSGNYTAKLQDASADDLGDSPPTWTDVAATDLLGSLPTALEANKVYRVGYRGGKQNVRVVLTKNSGTSIAAGAVVIKGHPAVAPVA